MIRVTELAGGCGYPLAQTRTEETMNADNKEIVSSIALWLAIITVFAIL